MEVVEEYAQTVRSVGLDPQHYVVIAKDGNRQTIECAATGTTFDVLNFGNNDILGMASNPRVRQAAIDAIDMFGTSNSSCATLCGRIAPHRELENEISDFKGLPHTYLFLNAWMAAQALIDGFCHLALPIPGYKNTRETLILSDVLNHGCLVSAVTGANQRSGKFLNKSPEVRTKAYRHCDVENLASKLKRFAKPDDRILVISDAVFSMDGDVAPLPDLIDVLSDYPGAVLLMDEAHSSGSLGKTGHGIYEHFGISPMDAKNKGVEPLVLTTFSKFAGSAGAAISSFSEAFCALVDVSPTSIGTISLPPPMAAATTAAIRELRANPDLPETLRENTRYLRSRLEEYGFEVMGQTNVVPLLLPEDIRPREFARQLIENYGIWVSPVWFIAKPRIRVVVNVLHTHEDLDRLVHALSETLAAFSQEKVVA